jgi:hypothetical protein
MEHKRSQTTHADCDSMMKGLMIMSYHFCKTLVRKMNPKMLSPACSALLMCSTLLAPDTGAAQAYVDQVGGNGRRSAYVEQMPIDAKPAQPKRILPVKRTGSQPKSDAAQVAKKGVPAGAATSAGDAAADVFPSVGAGSSAIVRLDESAIEWPTVGRGAVNR